MQSDRQLRADAGLGPDSAATVGVGNPVVLAAVASRAQGAARSSAGVTPFIDGLKVPV
jgi:hypothetical protein